MPALCLAAAGSWAAGRGGRTVAKFIQICASQDDLFALDEGGSIFQYNFNTKTWMELLAGRSDPTRAEEPSGRRSTDPR